jgi:hypothetical protein
MSWNKNVTLPHILLVLAQDLSSLKIMTAQVRIVL